MDPTTEAAAIFTRLFEVLARQSGKTLSAQSRTDIARACELLAQAGTELDELLDDFPLPPPPPPPSLPQRRSPGEYAAEDPNYERWRERRDRT